ISVSRGHESRCRDGQAKPPFPISRQFVADAHINTLSWIDFDLFNGRTGRNMTLSDCGSNKFPQMVDLRRGTGDWPGREIHARIQPEMSLTMKRSTWVKTAAAMNGRVIRLACLPQGQSAVPATFAVQRPEALAAVRGRKKGDWREAKT